MYSQENSTENHNSILLTIYINIHGLYYDYALFYPNVHTLSSCPLLIHYVSTLRPPCHVHVPWCHTFLISVIHVCTICILWGTYVPWYHSISRLFPILLDSKSFQTTLDSSRPMTSCHVTSQLCALSFSHYRLIIILYIYVWLTLTLSKVCPHSCLITLLAILKLEEIEKLIN